LANYEIQARPALNCPFFFGQVIKAAVLEEACPSPLMGKPSPEYKMWLWGRCIQCLAPDHNVAHCRDLPHCLNYFGSGHFARRCRALPDLWRALFLSPSLPKPDICARLTFPPGSIHNRLTFLELSYATATASPPAEPMVPGDCFVAIPSPEVSVGPHRCCCRGGGECHRSSRNFVVR
jgi:hypothetical protein